MSTVLPLLETKPLAYGESPTSTWFPDAQLKTASCVPEEGVGAYELLHRHHAHPLKQERIPRDYFKMPEAERTARIWELRRQLGDRLVVLGHHYQRDEVIQFADFRGDSFKLSQEAATLTDVDYVALLRRALHGRKRRHPHRPEAAGDPAESRSRLLDGRHGQHRRRRGVLDRAGRRSGSTGIVPITYMNSAASLKAFCGRNGGIVCTSSNAAVRLRLGVRARRKDSLLPRRASRPQHRRQEAHPARQDGRLGPVPAAWRQHAEELRNATVILWKGFCSVHARFSVEQIEQARRDYPDVNVIVHPECRAEVVAAADSDGSTEHIIKTIRNAPAGTTWAVGTEVNLVNRLQRRDAGQAHLLPRSGHLPVLDDVPRPPRLCALDA